MEQVFVMESCYVGNCCPKMATNCGGKPNGFGLGEGGV